MVTQRVYIFHDSIAANVAYGKEIDEAKVIDALKKATARLTKMGISNNL